MSDQPWNQQPQHVEPSKIIPLVDTITITIDNTKQPAPATMITSRALPIPYVCHILAGLIQNIIAMGAAQSAGTLPNAEPSANPRKNGGLGGR